MDKLGFIHEKLDVKVLILFILRRLPGAVDGEKLAELTLCDGGIGYFDYAECLGELLDTEHVEKVKAGYRITDKGARNAEIIENSLPYSVRVKAERALGPVADDIRRDSMIEASYKAGTAGTGTLTLSLSDGKGEIAFLRLLVSNDAQAKKMEERFRRDAEGVYAGIIDLLS